MLARGPATKISNEIKDLALTLQASLKKISF
jgi:hypothetical protein